ncbi:hypothetical protein BD289DRAFT_288100 [Coniella lustricola]|uniref:Uncharacterized protein n=1 Tax=Coniella lustricola TaxID=2025994 RepID=A0A2T3A5N4_9PEZI|nr:hypothetical protein BD289DRAFT_288100 [Coniella lustricola]
MDPADNVGATISHRRSGGRTLVARESSSSERKTKVAVAVVVLYALSKWVWTGSIASKVTATTTTVNGAPAAVAAAAAPAGGGGGDDGQLQAIMLALQLQRKSYESRCLDPAVPSGLFDVPDLNISPDKPLNPPRSFEEDVLWSVSRLGGGGLNLICCLLFPCLYLVSIATSEPRRQHPAMLQNCVPVRLLLWGFCGGAERNNKVSSRTVSLWVLCRLCLDDSDSRRQRNLGPDELPGRDPRQQKISLVEWALQL